MAELRFADGVLFFPVTPFDAGDRPALDLLAQHVSAGVEAGAGGVFAACGTGEYHALSIGEYRDVVVASVEATEGRVPVLAGCGGPLGHARESARAAAEAGAQGVLIMPPYLVQGPQAGLAAYIEAVAAETELPVVVYHRGAQTLTEPTVERLLVLDAVVGLKDGVGDIALMQRFALAAERSGRGILLFNGLLTAELSQAAYRAIGVPMYSSAVFAMAPEIAVAFYRALEAEDAATTRRLLDGFYTPLVRLRDETPGFAVSLIKAGLRVSGLSAGSVRPPLVDPTAEQEARLADLLTRGRELVA